MTTTVSVSSNSTTDDGGDGVADGGLANPIWASVLIVLFCSLIVVGTVVGNILVCTAVSIVRKLRTPSNWLIVSLAVADLLVALLVMPLAIVSEVRRQRTLCSWGLQHLMIILRETFNESFS